VPGRADVPQTRGRRLGRRTLLKQNPAITIENPHVDVCVPDTLTVRDVLVDHAGGQAADRVDGHDELSHDVQFPSSAAPVS